MSPYKGDNSGPGTPIGFGAFLVLGALVLKLFGIV
jgi:hypothetical protein